MRNDLSDAEIKRLLWKRLDYELKNLSISKKILALLQKEREMLEEIMLQYLECKSLSIQWPEPIFARDGSWKQPVSADFVKELDKRYKATKRLLSVLKMSETFKIGLMFLNVPRLQPKTEDEFHELATSFERLLNNLAANLNEFNEWLEEATHRRVSPGRGDRRPVAEEWLGEVVALLLRKLKIKIKDGTDSVYPEVLNAIHYACSKNEDKERDASALAEHIIEKWLPSNIRKRVELEKDPLI